MARKKVSEARLRPLLETAPWALADVIALQAMSVGNADSDQQIRALNWIIYKAAGFNDIAFRDTDRETAFIEGKKFVVHQLNALLTMNTRNIKE